MSLAASGIGWVHPNGQRALDDVRVDVGPGERVAVIGPSGAGKTSLLRLAGAAARPTQGALRILGEDPWALSPRALKALRARVGLVHQVPPIPPRLRVVTAVLAGRLAHWSTPRALASLAWPLDAQGASQALARVDLADRLFDRCDRLSGGQLQRVGIARVLYQAPELILADEPVSALDPTSADRAVGTLVEQSRQTGATLVASLHAVDIALRWFPRIVALREGRVAFDLPTTEVTESLLASLYASEGGHVPMQADAPDSAGRAEPMAVRGGILGSDDRPLCL